MSPKEINTERASWVHNQNGVDYGPYDTKTVEEMILAGEVVREDSLKEQYTGRACKPMDIPLFLDALNTFETQQRDAKMAKEADASYSDLKKRRKLMPLFLTLVAVLSVATGRETIEGWLDPSSRHTALAAVTIPVTPDPEVLIHALPSALEKKSASDTISSPKDTSSIRVRARKTPAPRKKKSTEKRPQPSTEQPIVQEFDFADDEIASDDDGDTNLPSPLGASELRQYMSERLKPAVMRCVRVHREDLKLSAYRVHLTLKPSGALSLSAITPAGANVPNLKDCLNLQVKRNQFRVFTGAERKLELPIKVQ